MFLSDTVDASKGVDALRSSKDLPTVERTAGASGATGTGETAGLVSGPTGTGEATGLVLGATSSSFLIIEGNSLPLFLPCV